MVKEILEKDKKVEEIGSSTGFYNGKKGGSLNNRKYIIHSSLFMKTQIK